MIAPSKITNFNRSEKELQEFLLFAIAVAGKSSGITAKKIDDFLYGQKLSGCKTPFEYVKFLDSNNMLEMEIEKHKLGQYKRIGPAFREVSRIKDLRKITIHQLEAIKGIGPKTSRFFVMHSQPNQKFAALDTHILRWLRNHGVSTPKSTPTGKRYLELEKKFLSYANDYDIDPVDLDLQIWTQYSKS